MNLKPDTTPLSCGCVITGGDDLTFKIVHCKLHAQAGAMAELLNRLIAETDAYGRERIAQTWPLLDQILTETESVLIAAGARQPRVQRYYVVLDVERDPNDPDTGTDWLKIQLEHSTGVTVAEAQVFGSRAELIKDEVEEGYGTGKETAAPEAP